RPDCLATAGHAMASSQAFRARWIGALRWPRGGRRTWGLLLREVRGRGCPPQDTGPLQEGRRRPGAAAPDFRLVRQDRALEGERGCGAAGRESGGPGGRVET